MSTSERQWLESMIKSLDGPTIYEQMIKEGWPIRGHSTHFEYIGEGYGVTIQHCIVCDEYLGVNYPGDLCRKHGG